MKRRSLLSFAILVISAGLSQTAFADTLSTFILTVNSPIQTAKPGTVLSYSATISNTSSADINLNGIEFNPTYSSTNTFALPDPSTGACPTNMPCIDITSFFNNFPATLSAMTSLSGILFTASVPLTSAITTFTGTVDITGGAGNDNSKSSTVAGFSATVTPEPSSWLLMATGILGLAIAYRFRPEAVSRLS